MYRKSDAFIRPCDKAMLLLCYKVTFKNVRFKKKVIALEKKSEWRKRFSSNSTGFAWITSPDDCSWKVVDRKRSDKRYETRVK